MKRDENEKKKKSYIQGEGYETKWKGKLVTN